MQEKWLLTARQHCDLELLAVGGFHPLSGFLGQEDYESVLQHSRLSTGQLWPMPITLDVPDAFAEKITVGDEIALCDSDNSILAYMTIEDKWRPNKALEARAVFNTEDCTHPGVNYLFHQAGNWYLGGSIKMVQLPAHYDFTSLRHTPASLKKHFSQLAEQNIVGFQTRNPLHRAHMELTLRAAEQIEGHILIHPAVGLTKPGDIDHFTRVRCYQKILRYYPPQKASLSLLPLAMRMGGPQEALWHALIRKNYGCTHFIVGRDHAGPGKDAQGTPFYDADAAQKRAMQYQDEIGIKILAFSEMVYVKERKKYAAVDELKNHETALSISGTELRHALLNDQEIPEWFSFPEIVEELRKSHLPKHAQGFTVFFTGLPSAGKTTLAKALMASLMSLGKKKVTLLDGDMVRRILANELGFSRADRDLNIRRIGFVAAEVTKAGGIALCAAIAPYKEVRAENRQLISQYGGFIEVYVSTPLATCEKRDPKGLYSKVRKGEIKGFTGIGDPYEVPTDMEIEIDTSQLTIEEALEKILDFLRNAGYLQ